ncbi:MAG: CPXCG motif-containing cysteine-rich protein [Armatimonadetes bacterium]|nr:CPXCG motif-containing cysteine-rich protein [Armatimonadota bacterium]
MEIEATWYCGYCGEENSSVVDITAGDEQTFVEDCSVCCNPNTLHIAVDRDNEDVDIEAEYEG